MTKVSKTALSQPALSQPVLSPPHSHDNDLQDMADAQEAEALLFQYIITTAGQLETPPVILKKLADNLGDPQRLPAAKLLQTTMGHPLSHPLTTLIAIEGLLDGTFEDSAETYERELASLENPQQASAPWISITHEEKDDETIPHTIISETPLNSDALIDRKPQKLFPAGRILLLGIAIIYGFLVYKTGQLSPSAIMESLKGQRAALMLAPGNAENTPGTETVPLAPANGTSAPQQGSPTLWQGEKDSSSAATQQGQQTVNHNGHGDPSQPAGQDPREARQTANPSNSVNEMKTAPPAPSHPAPREDHPGVITLPNE